MGKATQQVLVSEFRSAENRTQILTCTQGPESELCWDAEASKANQTGNLGALKDHLCIFTVLKVGVSRLPADENLLSKTTEKSNSSPSTKAHLGGGIRSSPVKLEGLFPGRGGLSGLRSLPDLPLLRKQASLEKALAGLTGGQRGQLKRQGLQEVS